MPGVRAQGREGGGTPWGPAQSMRLAFQTHSPTPIHLQPRHPRGAWWSGNSWGTLQERRGHQSRKKALPRCWGQQCEGGQAERRWRTRGETEETSDTHLRARLPGAAHPKSRSTLGGSGGRKRGEVTGNVHTKRRAACGGSWLGRKALRGFCVLGCGGKPGLSPWQGGGRSAPLTGMPEKAESTRGGQEHSPGWP